MNESMTAWSPVSGTAALVRTLSTIRDAGRVLALVSRSGESTLTRYADAIAASGIAAAQWIVQWGSGSEPVHASWPRLPGRETFAADLDLLASVFCTVMGTRFARIRVDVTTQRTCPRFHVDNVQARLLCTYRGPGTEYLDRRYADCSRLGPGSGGLPDESSGLVRDAAGVHRMPALTIALLKGGRWPHAGSQGAIHRSPEMSPGAGPRVMVAIDIP